MGLKSDSSVGHDGNFHSDVASDDGGHGTSEEGNGGPDFTNLSLDGQCKNDAHSDDKDCAVIILGSKERFSTLFEILIDLN